MKKVVISISGGLDSATVMGMYLDQGYMVQPISFNYGQLHSVELEHMEAIVDYYADRFKGMVYDVLKVDLGFLGEIGGSALTSDKMDVPTDRSTEEMEDIPSTYVPGRNTIFTAIALSVAEVIGAEVVALGANALDYSGYPDCRPEYFDAWNELAKLSSKTAVTGCPIAIEVPLLQKSKAEIIQAGVALKIPVPYSLTWSCYKGEFEPCGKCDSCLLRAKGFKEAGIEDPALLD